MPLFFAINQGLTLRIHSFFIFGCMKLLVSCFIMFLGVCLSGCLDREKEYDLLVGKPYTILGKFTKNCSGDAAANQKLQLVNSNYYRETETKIFASTTTDQNGNFEMIYNDPFQYTAYSAHSFVIQKETPSGQFVNQSVQLRAYDNLKVNLTDSVFSRLHLVFSGANSLTNMDSLFLRLVYLAEKNNVVERSISGPFNDGDITEFVYHNMSGQNYYFWAIGDTNFNSPYGIDRHPGNFDAGEILLQFCGEDTLHIDLSNIKK